MSKPLTPDLVLARSKSDKLSMVKKINLWGNDINDVKLLRQMPNVEVLSLSVNKISSLKEFGTCSKLEELYLRKNNITDLSEIRYLTNLQHLKILWLWDNPCFETPNYREYVIKLLPNLEKLDNEQITPEERSAAAKLNINFGDLQINSKDQDVEPQDNSGKNIPDYQNQKSYDYDDPQNMQKPKGDVNKKMNALPEQNNRDKVLGREFEREYYNDSVKQEKSVSNFRNENIISAISILLKELDEDGLDFLKKDIENRISIF